MLTNHRVLAAGAIAVLAVTGCNAGGGTLAPTGIISTAAPTASPSPSGTANPSPVATATPSPAPTASPVPTAGATATPSPAPTATPVPGATIQTVPGSFAFTSTGAGAALPLAPSEAGYNGAFGESDTCAAIASVSPASVPSGTPFTVTPLAAGACTITVHDASAVTAAVSVTVTTSGLVVQKAGHR